MPIGGPAVGCAGWWFGGLADVGQEASQELARLSRRERDEHAAVLVAAEIRPSYRQDATQFRHALLAARIHAQAPLKPFYTEARLR